MIRLTLAAWMLLATVLVAGCSFFASTEAAAPTSCRQLFNAVRCGVMTDTAALNLGLKREDITTLDVLPEPTPDPQAGVTALGGAPPIHVRATLVDGSTREASMGCGGVAEAWNPACQDDPHVTIKSAIDGYRDVPQGASPVPSAASDAIVRAKPLEIGRLDIPIDHVGSYEVALGEARLPNGLLTTATIDLVERWPAHVTIIGQDGLRLEIRSLEPDGRLFQNIYQHGWRPGTERVEAVLVFDVFRFDPGAMLAIKDVVVR